MSSRGRKGGKRVNDSDCTIDNVTVWPYTQEDGEEGCRRRGEGQERGGGVGNGE